ncbi:MAG: RDD family protein, partial [Planctomycetaceae bacterium]
MPAGLLRRFAAIVYDSLLLFAVLFFASLAVIVPFDIRYGDPLYSLYLLYTYAVGFLFFGWFWTHGGQTLGMRTWRIRLESAGGDIITWRRALLRYVAALLSWLLLGGGFLLSLVHP